MDILSRLRLARGLRWHHRQPTLNEAIAEAGSVARGAGVALALIVLYGIVGEMDYRDALRSEAEAQQTRAELNQAALLACLNGHATGHYTENRHGERAYIVCRGAEEIPVGRVVAKNG